MRLLILETVNDDTTEKRVAWLLPVTMLAQPRQSMARRNTVDHCTTVLSTTMIEGGTPVRLLILETVNGDTRGKRVVWPLSAAMWARSRRGEATNANGDHRARALSTTMIEGGTPMRLLILETVNGDTTGARAALTLPAAMLAQLRQGEAMGNIVCHCVESLSTTMI